MLRPKSAQNSFYGSYLYDRIVPQDHLLRKINAVVDFSFVNDLVKDRYTQGQDRGLLPKKSFFSSLVCGHKMCLAQIRAIPNFIERGQF